MRLRFLFLALATVVARVPGQTIRRTATIELERRAAVALHDLDSDGRSELVVAEASGRLRVWHHADGGGLAPGTGEIRLRHPARTLLGFAKLAGRQALLATAPDGLRAWTWSRDDGFGASAEHVKRARFALRVGRPRFASIVQDFNEDGRPDVVIPQRAACELWLRQPPGAAKGAPFRKTATIAVNVPHERRVEAERLSDLLLSRFTIPNVRTNDVNADKREDLLVEDGLKRSWHLQREDGTFPARPDVALDLAIYRDTTPRASGIQPGSTIANDQPARLQTRDLDGDGVPDYVITHRRKVWIFHGTKAGPQFEDPTAIMKVAEDITAALLVRLDDDERPDLLVVKVQVPSIATILLGLIGEWDISLRVLGYANEDGKRFGGTPRLRREVALRLPAITSLLKNPQKLIDRFVAIGRRFRAAVYGDFDGDGTGDVLLRADDDATLDVWIRKTAVKEASYDQERELRRVLFEDDDPVWDIDRILMFLGDMAGSRMSRLTAGEKPSLRHALRSGDDYRLQRVRTADLDGDGAAEIVLTYESNGASSGATIDVLEVGR